MGSYSELWFGKLYVTSTKSYLDQWVFRDSEKRITTGKVLPHDEDQTLDEDEEPYKRYFFESTVADIVKRLEIRGHNLEAAKRDLKNTVRDWLRDERESLDEGWREDRTVYDFFRSNSDPNRWIDAFRVILKENIKVYPSNWETSVSHENSIVNYVANKPSVWTEDKFYWLNVPITDFNNFARLVLEAFPASDRVILDATALVHGGYYQGFEAIENTQGESTKFFQTFLAEAQKIKELCAKKSFKKEQLFLGKLLYSHAITLMESYLSETLIYSILSFDPLMRRLLESDPEFKKRKSDYSDLFRTMDDLKDEVKTYLKSLLYHNLAKIRELYRSVLYVDFPQELTSIFKAIERRHDLVHRNGKDVDDFEFEVTFSQAVELVENITSFLRVVDIQVKNVYPSVVAIDEFDGAAEF